MERLANVERLARFGPSVDAGPPARVALLRTALIAGAVAAIAVAWGAASGAPRPADRELARLLLGMAAIKGLLTLGAAVAIGWRLGRPIVRPVACAYIVGVWAMFGAVGSIWQAAFVPLAAILFHGAGLVVLVVSMREGLGPSLRRWGR